MSVANIVDARSASRERAPRTGAATRLRAQPSIRRQYLSDLIARIIHVGVEDTRAAGSPFGHLIGRQLVDAHAFLARESVCAGLDAGNFLTQRPLGLPRGVHDDGPMAGRDRLPGL